MRQDIRINRYICIQNFCNFSILLLPCFSTSLKGLSHEIFTVIFWLEWTYLGLNENRCWFLNFKEGSLILCSYFKDRCVPYQTFSEILRISEKNWQLSLRFSNFSSFWVSGPPRNAAKGVNTSRRFYESPRMIDNQFRGSPRMFFNNISMSLRQLTILFGDSTNLQEGLVWSTSKLKIAAKNRRSFIKMFKPQAVHIQSQTHPYRPKNRPYNLMRQSL